MKVYIGSDHGGFELKQELLKLWPSMLNIPTQTNLSDVGCFTNSSTDYPDLAENVCTRIINDYMSQPKIIASEDAFAYNSLGILVCGSGQGMAMKANKYAQIRAALCWSPEITALAREHNNANILCLPGRFLNSSVAIEMVRVFLTTPFAKGRHALRVEKI
ncbi:MAG: RpiB/LacA/LacB family sugar-phosphate isomerase [Bdellovibrionaceae bacterium]|nr:RpiB/LacA/LacB family sugar-phosphate isomerase [Pseudobdellovibrionaceae bacterium]